MNVWLVAIVFFRANSANVFGGAHRFVAYGAAFFFFVGAIVPPSTISRASGPVKHQTMLTAARRSLFTARRCFASVPAAQPVNWYRGRVFVVCDGPLSNRCRCLVKLLLTIA